MSETEDLLRSIFTRNSYIGHDTYIMSIMIETHEIIAIKALGFVLERDSLRDRFIAMSGVDAAHMKDMLADHAALAGILEFLMAHEADLIDAANDQSVSPEDMIKAWRALGGGKGQEW